MRGLIGCLEILMEDTRHAILRLIGSCHMGSNLRIVGHSLTHESADLINDTQPANPYTSYLTS